MQSDMELPYERELFNLIRNRALMREWARNAQRRFGKPFTVNSLATLNMAEEVLPPEQYRLFRLRYSEAVKECK